MGRPFSYNDDNFTVIDNILFVHFNDTKERKSNEPVIQIPDEIYKRMYSYGNIVFVSPSKVMLEVCGLPFLLSITIINIILLLMIIDSLLGFLKDIIILFII